MMLEKVSEFESVQVALLIAITVITVFWMVARRWRQSEELASDDRRQKDLIPISQRIANHKAREQDAGHSLAKDY